MPTVLAIFISYGAWPHVLGHFEVDRSEAQLVAFLPRVDVSMTCGAGDADL